MIDRHESGLVRVLDAIRERRHLLHHQTEVLDIKREDAVYAICEQILREEMRRSASPRASVQKPTPYETFKAWMTDEGMVGSISVYRNSGSQHGFVGKPSDKDVGVSVIIEPVDNRQGRRLTEEELREVFGESIPLVALKLVMPGRCEPITVDELRSVLKAIAQPDRATEADLRELFSMEPDDGPLEDVIETHDGDWIKETLWRFDSHEESVA